jgi:small subunit ribosomal protein S7
MRGKQAPKRSIGPDHRYNNVLVAKFINRVMKHGKKSIAEKIVYSAFDILDQKIKKKELQELKEVQGALDVFDMALKNIAPSVEVKGRRVGGANYQVPIPVRGERKYYLAFTWMLEAARARKGASMEKRLSQEILDAFNNTGSAVKKREDVQRMAEANRAFAHFAR